MYFYYFNYVCVSVCIHAYEHRCLLGQRYQNTLGLKLQVTVSLLAWMPGTELWSFRRTICLSIAELVLKPLLFYLRWSLTM